MKISSIADYKAASAKIHQLSGAREGTAEAVELEMLVASVREWEGRNPQPGAASAPGNYKTPARPGQPGEESEVRPGPNPRSPHPSGPHTPYEADDPEGIAAEKHVAASPPEPVDPAAPANRPSGNIRST